VCWRVHTHTHIYKQAYVDVGLDKLYSHIVCVTIDGVLDNRVY
jgi:hypothetical protein